VNRKYHYASEDAWWVQRVNPEGTPEHYLAIAAMDVIARVEQLYDLHYEIPSRNMCKHCGFRWPCPTIETLDSIDQ